jgi:mRNA interferase RelE/StbE
MQIEFTKKFGKQIEKCLDNSIRARLLKVIDTILKAENLSDIKNIKKLKGHNNFYRLKIGDYRIGLVLEDNLVIFAAFDHRSNIYKYFP